MTQHTHNHDYQYQSGRLNLEGQVKPKYLEDAIENSEEAWEAHNELVDDEAGTPLIDFAEVFAHFCDLAKTAAYNRWHIEQREQECEQYGHLPVVCMTGNYYFYEGMPDDDITEQMFCSRCGKVLVG